MLIVMIPFEWKNNNSLMLTSLAAPGGKTSLSGFSVCHYKYFLQRVYFNQGSTQLSC